MTAKFFTHDGKFDVDAWNRECERRNQEREIRRKEIIRRMKSTHTTDRLRKHRVQSLTKQGYNALPTPRHVTNPHSYESGSYYNPHRTGVYDNEQE